MACMRCANGRIVLKYIAIRVYCQSRVPSIESSVRFFECVTVESTIAEFMTVKLGTKGNSRVGVTEYLKN